MGNRQKDKLRRMDVLGLNLRTQTNMFPRRQLGQKPESLGGGASGGFPKACESVAGMGWLVPPPLHMWRSSASILQNVTIFEDGEFKEAFKVNEVTRTPIVQQAIRTQTCTEGRPRENKGKNAICTSRETSGEISPADALILDFQTLEL